MEQLQNRPEEPFVSSMKDWGSSSRCTSYHDREGGRNFDGVDLLPGRDHGERLTMFDHIACIKATQHCSPNTQTLALFGFCRAVP